jgi:hypothetical protein
MPQPVKKISVAGIQVAIWENTGKDNQSFYSVSLDKRYKDPADGWKSSSSFKATDLPKAILALQKAYEFLVLKESDPLVSTEYS